ncbi:hypothetical protein PG997_015232 [Apiospora hydei]|uniref:Uncharacterized protein n=1 Tax=Apiospora hydei TaxID=1337664 RepID=A0ABR1USG8_9PEZI
MPGMAGLFRRLKKRGTEYIRSRTGDSNNASQVLKSGSRPGLSYFKKGNGGDGITKTTVVSVQRTRGGGDDASESEVELVNRSKESHNNFQNGFGEAV